MKKLLTWLLSASFAYAAGPDPSQVDEIFAPFSSSSSPGCELGVLSGGEFVYKKAYGLSDLEQHIALTTASPIYVRVALEGYFK
jgi:CubicO group peptidase (beta-lactamase class C family)